jgi:hyperpolarization activated cyclic nucleotide-gated potassium channel 2
VNYKARLEVMLRRVAKELGEPSPLMEPDRQDATKKSCSLPVFKHGSRIARGWDFLHLALMTYAFLLIPYNFAFEESENQTPWVYVNGVVDVLFACDIVMKLNTGFCDQSYRLITSRWEIYRRYGGNWLAVDLIATLPLHLISTQLLAGRLSRVNRLVRLLRILKVFQLFQKSRGLDMMDTFNIRLSTFRFVSFITATLLASHIFTCLWCFIGIAEVDDPDNWISTYRKNDLSDVDLYLVAFNWTIQTLATCGFGDIVPCTTLERLAGIMWMSFALLFVSYTVGCLGIVLDPQNSKENVLIRKQSIIDEFAADAQLPSELRFQLRNTIRQSIQNSDSLHLEVLSTFQDLPEDLRYEIAQVIHRGALKNLRFFNERVKGFIVDVFPLLKHRSVPQNFSVYETMQAPEHVYFLLIGVCIVLTQEMNVIKRLRGGSYFGDIEIFNGRARLHTVKTISDCEFLTLNRPLLSLIKKKYSSIYEEMEVTAKNKESEWARAARQIAQLKHKLRMTRRKSTDELLFDVRARRRSSGNLVGPPNIAQLRLSQLQLRTTAAAKSLEELQLMFAKIAQFTGIDVALESKRSSLSSDYDIYSGYSTPLQSD